jgi:phosphonate transport system substrate-binding protein
MLSIQFYQRNIIAVFIAISSLLISCGGESQDNTPKFSSEAPVKSNTYIFAIHPLHNPEKLFTVYGPLMDYLSKKIPGAVFQLQASRNYAEFEERLYKGVYDFALPNPYQTLLSTSKGYHVIAKMGDNHLFTGVILVRRDSGIKKVTDLKGKKISYPAPTALAATMMPQYYFYTHGLNVMKDAENIYVGSQESSIMNVYLGFTSAGSTWPLPWEAFQKEHPDKAEDLMVAWETEPLINNGVVARNDVSPELAEAVAKHLSELHLSEEGRKILSRMPLSKFERAQNKDYKVIEKFLKEFSAKVRPVL